MSARVTSTGEVVTARPSVPGTWRRSWAGVASVRTDVVSMRFVATSIAFLAVGGVVGLVMRAQLSWPTAHVVDPEGYAQAFTFHGTTMVLLFAAPFLFGLATALLGTSSVSGRLALPRLHAFAYWCYVAGGLVFLASLASATPPDAGWTETAPLSGPVYSPRNGTEYWIVAAALVAVAMVALSIQVIVTIADGLRVGPRLERGSGALGWAAVSASGIVLVAVVPLFAGLGMLGSDRLFGTGFFDETLGGDALLWQHLSFGFSVPLFVALFVLGAGLVCRVVEDVTGLPLVGASWVRAAFAFAAVVAVVSWGRELASSGVSGLAQSLFGAASVLVVIPIAIVIVSWLATLWAAPATYGATSTFVAGTALLAALVVCGTVATSIPASATSIGGSVFVVGLIHSIAFGGVVFPGMAVLVGRPGGDRGGPWARAGALVSLVGVFLFVAPMYLLGLRGAPRRAYTYDVATGFQALNVVETLGAALLAVGLIVTLASALGSRAVGRDEAVASGILPTRPRDRVMASSGVPVLAAVALTIALLGMLSYEPWLAGIGAVLVLLVLGGAAAAARSRTDELVFPGDGRPALWIALGVGVGVVAAFVAAYGYLALATSTWPPLLKFGYPPGLVLPTIAGGLLVLGAIAARAFGDWRALSIVLAVVALAAGAVEVVWLGTLPFEPAEDVYASSTFLLGWCLVAAAAVLAVGAIVDALSPRPTDGRERDPDVEARVGPLVPFATAAAVVAVLSWFTTSILPVIIG
jgi:cytochrome c oxidase subunit I+III